MNTPKLLEYFTERQHKILDLTRRLCEIESPSRDVQGSRAAVDLLATEAAQISAVSSIEKIPVEGYGEHLIIRAFDDARAKPVLLLGHTDTVYPRGALAARPWRVENEKIFAPGIFDMKSGCVLILAVLHALAELNLKLSRPLTVLLSCDEEIGSETGREFVEREARTAEFCLVCEPSAPGGAVKTARKGTGNYVLKAHGVASHAGLEPTRGASAILEMARQIPAIHSFEKPEIGTTVNVCTIGGGTATNVIPAEAECSIDVRFTTTGEANRVATAIKNLKPHDERIRLELSGEINRPPLERTASVAALYEKARQIAASFNYELNETQVGGASDGNFVAASGVPVLDGLGVQGDGAHTDHEYILASDIPPRAALIAALLIS